MTRHHERVQLDVLPDGTPTGAPAKRGLEERLRHAGVTFEEAVRVRAYQNWERAGRPAGDGTRFWFEAEADLEMDRE